MLMEVCDLRKSFKHGRVRAVDGISFSIQKNETLGIVGASGSGKSTLAKMILGILKPDSGTLRYQGRRLGAVFQEPSLSLNPKMTVRQILEEPLRVGGLESQSDRLARVKEALSAVELPSYFESRYPRALSGGECQRVAIARALIGRPELIVCDEPVSSLDTLVRAQILNLLLKLQREHQISYFFISHDMAVVRHMSDRVLVIEDGKVIN